MNLRRKIVVSIFSFAVVGLARAGALIPAPLTGRVGIVGGIETLIIDGRIHYFGFSYGSDLVLSPLIDTPEAMAQFAADYMTQNDGAHDAAYWRELVNDAVTYSALASDTASRTIKRAALRRSVETISRAERKNQRTRGLSFEYHLLYLLAAAADGNDALERTEEFKKLDFVESDSPMMMVLDSIDFLNGKTKLPRGASYRDAAYVARVTLDFLVKKAPENWASVFDVLRDPK